MVLQDAVHLVQGPCCKWGGGGVPCRDLAGSLTSQGHPGHRGGMHAAVGMVMSPVCQVLPGPSRKAQWGGGVGGGGAGRQGKRLEDNIREWTGLEFAKYQRAVENKEKWRKLVAKSSVVPQ